MVVTALINEMKLVQVADGLEIDLTPLQGSWTVQQYLKLTNSTNLPIEFTDGVLELLPMPTRKHQRILMFLYRALFPLMERIGGEVLTAALSLEIREDKFREPDLLLFLDRDDPRNQNDYWRGADLVLEVVSPDKPERDFVVKRVDYAEARIPEYWIVNPLDETITVLTLNGEVYMEHGIFRRGEAATSALLSDFRVAVAELFDAG
jgi:Uma2 family endonuclease